MMQKIKNYITHNCTIKNILILFLIVQPIFDLKIFYGSISTFIRVFFIFLFFIYYFINSKNKKKYFLFFYPILILIYFIFHHLNALKFTSLVPGNFNYSIFQEALYFIKMLCPYMLIYCLFKSKITKKELFFIIKICVLVISLIIIISNLFLISYGTYSDIKIKANFLEWFNPNSSYTYQDLASKGLFEVGNQISAILLMFLPFTIILTLENKTINNFFILLCNILGLLFLGTKVAVLGITIVFIYTCGIYIFINHKFKNLSFIMIIFGIYICLLPFNPTFLRIAENKKIIEASSSSIVTPENPSTTYNIETLDENSFDYKKDYVKKNHAANNINQNFILNRYPYEHDVDFWYDIIKSNNPLKADYRFLEEAMVKRVIEINDNKFDFLFGITYTRIQNIFNIEKDFVMQYYSLGIIGLILVLCPYFVLIFYRIYNALRNKLKDLTITPLLSFTTVCMILFVAYYSGNLLNSLGFGIYLALMFYFTIQKRLINIFFCYIISKNLKHSEVHDVF